MKIPSDELIALEDGFWYWWPKHDGAIGAHVLREFAEQLDALNKPWSDEIDRYFKEREGK